MAFRIYQTADGHMPPWEYLPLDFDVTPQVGLALIMNAGVLTALSAETDKPQFICMQEGKEEEFVPVIRVSDDIIFETRNTESFEYIFVGDKVTVEDGLFVTATTEGGVATVIDSDAPAKDSRVRVKFSDPEADPGV